MKMLIYFILFIGIICPDPRKPSKLVKKCFIESIGEKETKALLSSFRKYHRSNGKAKFAKFITEKKPELKETLQKCSIKKKMILNKSKTKEGKKFLSPNIKRSFKK